MTIQLTLNKPLIVEAIKNETFHRGQIDKTPAATTPPGSAASTIAFAYHEEAGDETYHERIIQRSIAANLSDFKTLLCDYLTASGQTSADNVAQTTDGDNIILTLLVSDRFNTSMTDALAKLASEYIINASLMDWYKPFNEKQSALYASFLERNITAVRRCFNKTAPIVPTYRYPTTLSVVGSAIDLGIGEEHTVTYSISDGAIDDIEIRIEDEHIITAGRSIEGFTIIGRQLGHTYIQLYSRHNEELNRTLHVYVTDQS